MSMGHWKTTPSAQLNQHCATALRISVAGSYSMNPPKKYRAGDGRPVDLCQKVRRQLTPPVIGLYIGLCQAKFGRR